MLAEFLKIRQDLVKSIDFACSQAGKGGAGGDVVPKAQYNELEAENRKLKY